MSRTCRQQGGLRNSQEQEASPKPVANTAESNSTGGGWGRLPVLQEGYDKAVCWQGGEAETWTRLLQEWRALERGNSPAAGKCQPREHLCSPELSKSMPLPWQPIPALPGRSAPGPGPCSLAGSSKCSQFPYPCSKAATIPIVAASARKEPQSYMLRPWNLNTW